MVPYSFNVVFAWHELPEYYNCNPSGVQCGFIRDHALSMLHMFLAFNVSRKNDASKVNALEVFLMWAASINIWSVSLCLFGIKWMLSQSRVLDLFSVSLPWFSLTLSCRLVIFGDKGNQEQAYIFEWFDCRWPTAFCH